MPIEKVIVLEDDLIVRKNLEQQLRNRRYDVASVATVAAAKELLSKDNFDLIFADVRLPDGEGTDLLREIQTRAQKPLVVMVTGFGSVESAVNCMRAGAFDYMIKPFSSDQIDFTLKKAADYTQLIKVNHYLSREESELSGYELLGKSPAMEQLRQLIRKVARTQATVLIQGESGTGKELVARAIYLESPRASAPFIKVNCAAIPENLIESEFFGHEKGAFTGALNKREGRFELAHGGTILLDEISEVSPQVQAKLLRVLQERELERVGGSRTIQVDVRVIATTNRNLEQSVERKEFRQDLFFRLNVVPIPVPPLRDRISDVSFLAE
ncbi:MAG: atoC 3, partial [Verrucomicrobiales bacterium]|nr:atoC 3 [Verrucomicrobiales bacterium]